MATYESQVATIDMVPSISVHVSLNISTTRPEREDAVAIEAAMPAMSIAYSTGWHRAQTSTSSFPRASR